MALAYRIHRMGLLTDWQYRSICIDLTQKGYRNDEPNGIPREKSRIWKLVLEDLWREGKTKNAIAHDIDLPPDEIEKLTYGLTADPVRPKKRNSLHVIRNTS